jgi:hypothetical protein
VRSAVLAALLVAVPATAQQPAPASGTAASRRSTFALVAGGLAGGIAGTIAGVQIGKRIYEPDPTCEDCGRWGAGTGAALGSMVGVPLGVHLANRASGDLTQTLVRAAAVMAGFWGATYLLQRADIEGWDMLVVAGAYAAGTFTAVRAERAAERGAAPSPP